MPDMAGVKNLGMFLTVNNRIADMIEFDVAVMGSSTGEEKATTEGGGKAGANIRVISLELGGKTQTASAVAHTDERVSHVKFRVPVALPQQE